MRSASSNRRPCFDAGQTALELSVLVVAVVTACMLMAQYVKESLRANVKMTEMQLNSGIEDNRP